MAQDSYVRCYHQGKLADGVLSCIVFAASCGSTIIAELKVKKISNNKIAAPLSEYQ